MLHMFSPLARQRYASMPALLDAGALFTMLTLMYVMRCCALIIVLRCHAADADAAHLDYFTPS